MIILKSGTNTIINGNEVTPCPLSIFIQCLLTTMKVKISSLLLQYQLKVHVWPLYFVVEKHTFWSKRQSTQKSLFFWYPLILKTSIRILFEHDGIIRINYDWSTQKTLIGFWRSHDHAQHMHDHFSHAWFDSSKVHICSWFILYTSPNVSNLMYRKK